MFVVMFCFYLFYHLVAMLCTGGMGLMSVAKPMISEVFSSSMPAIVTASFASSYLLAMAGGLCPNVVSLGGSSAVSISALLLRKS